MVLEQPWISDNWHVSSLNFISGKKIQQDVTITDCTLRDGEQQSGIVFSREEKLRIARMLDEIHVHQIEAGMPAVSSEDFEAVKAIGKEKLQAHIYALSRAIKSDVDLILACDVPGIQISMPSGELQLKYKLKWPEERVIETAIEIIDYAKKHGLWVNLSPYDTTRSDISFLERYIRRVTEETDVDRIRIVDTVGSAKPSAIAYLTKLMLGWSNGVPLEIHCHNDFGLAVANSLSALEEGASAVSTTINGIGERVGNAPTEEIVMALLVLYGVDTGVDTRRLTEISKLVQSLSGVTMAPNKPVVGDGAFRHESGISVDGILELPWTGEAYSPDIVGQTRQIVLGKKSGKKSIELALRKSNLSADSQQLAKILEEVKAKSIARKDVIDDETFKEIAERIIKQQSLQQASKPGI